MARVFVVADSLTTTQVRKAIVAHRGIVRDDPETPTSITAQDSDGMPFVGVSGPEAWCFKSVALRPDQAALVVSAIDAAGPA